MFPGAKLLREGEEQLTGEKSQRASHYGWFPAGLDLGQQPK
jgi:hypothetical protein